MAYQSFDFWAYLTKLFQKHVVCHKLNIYVFVALLFTFYFSELISLWRRINTIHMLTSFYLSPTSWYWDSFLRKVQNKYVHVFKLKNVSILILIRHLNLSCLRIGVSWNMASKKQTKKTTHRTLTELERKFKGMFVWWNISELVILMSIKNSIWLPEQIMPFNLLSL